MPIKPESCVTVACDVCGYRYDQDEYVVHFDNVDEARKLLRAAEGWLITADGRVYCAAEDPEHQAELDALMPPKFQPTNQTELEINS